MAAITTEEAARRLARVILSDVELYNRERPRDGETLEDQYAEGRRLFATRVSPEMVGIFDAVLADRKNGKSMIPGHANGHAPANGQSAAAVPAVEAAPAEGKSPTQAPEITAIEPPAPAAETPVVVAPPPAAESAVAVERFAAAAPAPATASTDEPTNEFPDDEVTAAGSATVESSIHDQPTSPTASDDTTAERAPIPDLAALASASDGTAPLSQLGDEPVRPLVEVASNVHRPTDKTPRPRTPTPVVAARPVTPKPQRKAGTPPPTPKTATATPSPITKAPTPPPLLKVPTPEPQPLPVVAAAVAAVPVATPETDRAPTPPQPIPIAAVPLAEPPVAEVATTAPASGAVPTLKVRVSVPKILLVVAVAAGLIAVIAHFARLSP